MLKKRYVSIFVIYPWKEFENEVTNLENNINIELFFSKTLLEIEAHSDIMIQGEGGTTEILRQYIV